AGAKQLVATLEPSLRRLLAGGHVKHCAALRVATSQVCHCANYTIDRCRRHLVTELLDPVAAHPAAAQEPVDLLELVVPTFRGIRPDESQTKDVARNAPFGGSHEDLFGNPLARYITVRRRVTFAIGQRRLVDEAACIGGNVKAEHTQRRAVVDQLSPPVHCPPEKLMR